MPALQVQKLIEAIFAVPDGIGGNRRPMRVRASVVLARREQQPHCPEEAARRLLLTSSGCTFLAPRARLAPRCLPCPRVRPSR